VTEQTSFTTANSVKVPSVRLLIVLLREVGFDQSRRSSCADLEDALATAPP
jgi:hypothetical protein